MNDEIVTKLLHNYGIRRGRRLNMQKGYRNESHAVELSGGKTRNLIIYKSEPKILDRIKRANSIADYLAKKGMPARRTADPRVTCMRAGKILKYAALYEYLPGKTIPWEAYTQSYIKALGHGMRDMHYHLQDYRPKLNNDIADEYLEIWDEMQTYFANPGVVAATANKLNLALPPATLAKFPPILNGCKSLPGQQPLHMDFVRGNILFVPRAKISGILDFEKTGHGHPLLDISRTLAFLLVDCKYEQPAKVRKYFLYSGYNKNNQGKFKISQKTLPLLDQLINLFLLHDFYKFLRHNPYDFLHQNEHFVRTRDILLAKGLITSARIQENKGREEDGIRVEKAPDFAKRPNDFARTTKRQG